MSVRIEPQAGFQLKLSGDIETAISLSARAVSDDFVVAFSDGTLLRGSYDFALEECRFAVAIEGAGTTKIRRDSDGDQVELDWRIEWVSVVPGSQALLPTASEIDAEQPQLWDVREAA